MLRPQGHPLQAVLSDWGGGLTSPLCPPASPRRQRDWWLYPSGPDPEGPSSFWRLEVTAASVPCHLLTVEVAGDSGGFTGS